VRIVRYISSNGSRLMEMANSLDFLKEYDVLEHFILWWLLLEHSTWWPWRTVPFVLVFMFHASDLWVWTRNWTSLYLPIISFAFGLAPILYLVLKISVDSRILIGHVLENFYNGLVVATCVLELFYTFGVWKAFFKYFVLWSVRSMDSIMGYLLSY